MNAAASDILGREALSIAIGRPEARRTPRREGGSRFHGSTGVRLSLAGACLLTTACLAGRPRQSGLQQRLGGSSVSSTELKVRVYTLADRLAGMVENAADRIREESSDPGVRHRALIWKADAIPEIYRAAFWPDPLASSLDLWALLRQMELYFEEGAGRETFGPEQSIALDTVKKMEALGEEMAASVVRFPERLARLRNAVDTFGRSYPIEGNFSSRRSVGAHVAEFFDPGSQGAFSAIGEAADMVSDVSVRLNTYATTLPRQARWQGELLVNGVLQSAEATQTLKELNAIGDTARRADALLGDVPGTVEAAIAPAREALAGEREAVFASVDRQRLALTDSLTKERQTLVAAIETQRAAVMADVARERAAILSEADAIARRALSDVSGRARGVVDYVFWRLMILLGVAALLAVVAYRLAVGSRRAATAG